VAGAPDAQTTQYDPFIDRWASPRSFGPPKLDYIGGVWTGLEIFVTGRLGRERRPLAALFYP
jgi:hypothetical protein